jgi:hypothetical protein
MLRACSALAGELCTVILGMDKPKYLHQQPFYVPINSISPFNSFVHPQRVMSRRRCVMARLKV